MFKHILVPLDGSRLAEDILGPVESFATHFGSRVTLLHVVERDPPERVHGEPHLTTKTESENYLDGVARHMIATGLQVDVHVHERSVADVAAALDAHAHEYEVDLIAMCKHGRSGIRDVVAGGIAQQIMRGGGTSILLRPPQEEHVAAKFELEKILLPIDLQHDRDAVIESGSVIARAYGSSIRLLTVVPSLATARQGSVAARLLPGATAESLRMEIDEAAEQLTAHAGRFKDAGIDTTATIRHEEPAAAILDEARTSGSDLIILSTHAQSGFNAWYGGSTGLRVITGSPVTLLLLREL
jgi:nucleotide-binding universal stress UspA family protein